MDGLRLKHLRELLGASQRELAEKIGVAPSTFAMYERGSREPNDEIKLKIANYFKVTVDYLLGNDTSLENVKFANSGGLDVDGLDKNDIDEIKRQIEYMKWKKSQGNK